MYDIIIVGAGPAGLTAAIYGRRANKSVLVLEAKSYGGQIINTLDIENYPANNHISGFDFATNLYNQAKELGAEIVFDKVVEVTDSKQVITTTNKYQAKSIILATGSDNRKLGLSNEQELIGKGISYCATCDGAFFKNKDVAVVGGGNTALEDALYLSNIANKVYLIHRRETFRGEDKTVSQLKAKNNVEFVFNSSVTKLIADDRLNSIEVTDNEGNTRTINVDGLFVAIGRAPETDSYRNIININEAGYIVAGEDCTTNVPGIFVAGDTRTKEVRQLVTATADGAVAASKAIKYVESGE